MSFINSHTSTLFHYTNKGINIISILREGLKYSYCKEEFTSEICIGIPMISFCDIPISRCVEHNSKYGFYAIGLSKEFLVKMFSNRINPVNYILSDEQIKAAYLLRQDYLQAERKWLNDVEKVKSEGAKEIEGNICGLENYKGIGMSLKSPEMKTMLETFFKINERHPSANIMIAYMKNYNGIYKNRRFCNYDECEWRMVVPEYSTKINGELCDWFWSESEYEKWRKSVENKFIDVPPLKFSVNDINYILVHKKDNIPHFVKKISKLDTLCGETLSESDKILLYSKIISFDTIKMDF